MLGVEKPFLELTAIRMTRFHQSVPSKKGIIPAMDGVLLPGIPVKLRKEIEGPFLGSVEVPLDNMKYVFKESEVTVVFPAQIPSIPKGPVVSRFLAKVALEAMAQRIIDYPLSLDYLINEG